MKTFLITLLIPFTLSATCKNCDFPYEGCFKVYRHHYESTAIFYSGKVLDHYDLLNDREIAIFYSGAAFSLEQMMLLGEKY
jgi:hypothetical protein